MAVVEEASTAVAEEPSTAVGACAPVAEADSGEGRIRHPLPATEGHLLELLLLRGQRAGTQRGRVTAILDPAAISRLGISELEIPPRHPLVVPTANGTPLATRLEAVSLQVRNRKLGPRVTREISMSLAVIVERQLLERRVAFQARVGKSGRILPPRKMLFPGLNRFPPSTIRSGAHPL
jgi:hypothetical protein